MEDLLKKAEWIEKHLKNIELSDGGTRTVWTEDTPENAREWFQGVTSSYTDYTLSELDEQYRMLRKTANIITESGAESVDDLGEQVYSASMAYDGHADLLEWFAESPARLDLIDEILDEQGRVNTIGDTMRDAMERSRQSVAMYIINKLDELEIS